LGRNLNDFYRRLVSPGEFITRDSSGREIRKRAPSEFELISPYRFNVDISITKPGIQECKIANAKFFSGDFLSLAVQEIDIPNITAGDSTEQPTTFTGHLSLPDNSRTYTSENEIEISFLNSVYAPHENFFFNWLRETRSSTWIYDNYPFCKANIDVIGYSNYDEDFAIDFTGDRQNLNLGDYNGRPTVKYKFIDVFPVEIETASFKQEYATNESRSVKFRFNYMTVNDQDLSSLPLATPINQTRDAVRQLPTLPTDGSSISPLRGGVNS
jgi:hypothetical protein